MIFVTTGTQFSFDRLVATVDTWAKINKDVEYILAQTWQTASDFKYIQTQDFLSPAEYSSALKKSSLLIGHAGMGTIITAHEQSLPLIIMPRKFSLGEHRNDHQLATVTKFEDTCGVYVANNVEEMHSLLDRRSELKKCGEYKPANRTKLINFLKNEIHS
jgi:UDP-N-acetylglucosamine transferase subunit ALG13